MKNKKIFQIIFILLLLWISITSMIYRIRNRTKTETEVFFHIPKSFICDFKGE